MQRRRSGHYAEALERRVLLCAQPHNFGSSSGSHGGPVTFDVHAEPAQMPESSGGPNLHLTSIELVDGNFSPIAAPMVGEVTVVRAVWSTSGLNFSDVYIVRFLVDGVALDTSLITGQPGTNLVYQQYRWGWFASPGAHTVQVTVDANNSVAETDETDNMLSMNFNPAPVSGLPGQFVNPIAGQQSRDWTIVNYLDIDPRPAVARDYLSGPFQYEGHTGIDYTVANFAVMDRGLALVAAAGGTVTVVQDGYFDRETSANSNTPNYVRINHGNGWVSEYYHIATNTIAVKAGDQVVAGQFIGLTGSSGNSTDAHLHFQVSHNGMFVETYYAPTQYWANPVPYQGSLAGDIMDSGIANYTVWPDFKERPSGVSVFKLGQLDTVWFWNRSSHFRPGQFVTIDWYRPDGSLYTQYTYNAPGTIRYGTHAWTIGSAQWSQAEGLWQVALNVSGVERARQSFLVSATGAPEIKVSQGATYVIDGRTTPISFGTIPLGGSPPTRSFGIQNHGSETLTLSDLVLPPGFSLVGSFPSSVAPAGVMNFSVAMSSSAVGSRFGELSFTTKDSDEQHFNFNIGGTVSGSEPFGAPLIQFFGGSRSFYVGSGAKVIDATAQLFDVDFSLMDQLIVELAGNASPEDQLGIRHQGDGAGEIGVNGSVVSYKGTPIGTFTAPPGGSLVVDLSGIANVFTTEALLRNLTYANSAATPSTLRRYLRFSLIDETGQISNQPIKRVVFDTYPRPTALGSELRYQQAPHVFEIGFSENVGASLSASDLEVVNLATGVPVPAGSIAVTFNSTTNIADFTFPGFANGVLPDGNYRATLRGLGVSNNAGIPMAGDLQFGFFFLSGDANHDGIVNLQDFDTLAANFGQSPRDFTQGDFTYDGLVNLADFNILAARFGLVLTGTESDSGGGKGSPASPFSATRASPTNDPLQELLD